MSRRSVGSVVSLSWLVASVGWSCAGPIRQTSDSFNTRPPQSADLARYAHTVAGREIAAYAGRPLGDALAQLRPDWLRANPLLRGTGETAWPVVYTNDAPSGDIRALQTIPSDAAVEVQLLTPSEARTRYGAACRCPAGVIRVRTRSDA